MEPTKQPSDSYQFINNYRFSDINKIKNFEEISELRNRILLCNDTVQSDKKIDLTHKNFILNKSNTLINQIDHISNTINRSVFVNLKEGNGFSVLEDYKKPKLQKKLSDVTVKSRTYENEIKNKKMFTGAEIKNHIASLRNLNPADIVILFDGRPLGDSENVINILKRHPELTLRWKD